MAETAYASCGDLSLAYQVFGDGPVELVVAGSFISHVELFWTMPEFEAFFEQLATFCRVLLFDKAGVGLSDPVPHVRTLDDRAAEIEAVMDAAGFEQAVLFGIGDGGPGTIVFAATRPERTRALILTGTTSFTGFFNGWADIDRDPAELRARLVPELGEDYTPSTEQIARIQEFARAVRSTVGHRCGIKALPARRSGRRCASSECWSGCAPARGWRERHWKRCSGSTCGRSCRRSPRQRWSSVPATTPVPVQYDRYLADHIRGRAVP